MVEWFPRTNEGRTTFESELEHVFRSYGPRHRIHLMIKGQELCLSLFAKERITVVTTWFDVYHHLCTSTTFHFTIVKSQLIVGCIGPEYG